MINKIRALLRRAAVLGLQNFLGLTAVSLNETLPKGPILVLAPHPDDETLGCGATILHLKEKGCKIRIVIITDGATSTDMNGAEASQIVKARRTETQKAAKILGLPETELVFLPYPDRAAQEHIDKIAQDILAQIWLCSPVVIFSPFGDDSHPDHRAVASAMTKLWDEGKISCRLLEYPMWFWPQQALRCFFQPGFFQSVRALRTQKYLKAKEQAAAVYESLFCKRTNVRSKPAALSEAFLKDCLGPFEIFFERLDK